MTWSTRLGLGTLICCGRESVQSLGFAGATWYPIRRAAVTTYTSPRRGVEDAFLAQQRPTEVVPILQTAQRPN